ncbi:hypothetical protein FCM35_KLT08226 [Carex littledalei]|uniref:Uncharacterized protein n=1 Tax=Carex littledalei TaxID=544730 RepID=A0A833QR69_9POAL|nr:hypothetical protein FCM35_KLT08226 [Carex littledalei]
MFWSCLNTSGLSRSSSVGTSFNSDFLAGFSTAACKRSYNYSDSQESDPEFHIYSFEMIPGQYPLLIGDATNRDLLKLHLLSSRLEILSKDVQFARLEITAEEVQFPIIIRRQYTPVPHGNILAPLRGARKGWMVLSENLAGG